MPTVLPKSDDGGLGGQRRGAAQVTDSAYATHLNGKADQPVGQHAHAVHHEVHHHGVIGVLGAAEASFHDGETGLHEHDQEAGDQRPHEVDGDLVLPDLVDDVADREALGAVTYGHVAHGSRKRSARVAHGALVRRRGSHVLHVVHRQHRGTGRRGWCGSLRSGCGRCCRSLCKTHRRQQKQHGQKNHCPDNRSLRLH